MHVKPYMKSLATFLILTLILFANPLRANVKESNWISPWETFEEAFPRSLRLVRRISIEESWNRGFEELEKYSLLHNEWSFENDRVLFVKIQEILGKYGNEIALERIPQLKLYLQNRIKRYSSALPENVISSYYFYLDFFPEDKRIPLLFQESFLKINPDARFIGDSESKLFLYMIQDLISQNKEIHFNYFKLLLNYCESFSDQSKIRQEALLLLLTLFESKEEQLGQISIEEWDQLITKRTMLFKNFRKNKLSEQINENLKIKSEENLYINSIIMQNKLWDYQNLQTSLNWNSTEVKKIIEHAHISLRNQFSNSRPKETYQILFSQIEILRTLLDLKTSLDSENQSIITKGLATKWYQKLVAFHSQALSILQLTQYSTSLIFQCYQQNLNSKTCQNYRDYLPFQHSESQSIKPVLQEKKLSSIPSPSNLPKLNNPSAWTLNEPYIYFPPGRFEFEPNSNIIIKADRIEFHPLAIIFAPSGSVSIDALEMDSPWIDVSGKETVQIPHLISPGKRPWVKDAVHCQVRQYIDGATLVSIPKKHCGNKVSQRESCGTKLKWTLFTIKNPYPTVTVCASHAIDPDKNLVGDIDRILDLGEAPEEPSTKNWINEPNGPHGGTISLTVQDQFFNPLLIAQGANGKPGLNGQASPLCNINNEFKSYKIVVSQSEDEYNKWVETTKSNPFVKITPLQNEIYHHIGLLEVFLPRTSGTDAGSGGEGGQIKVNVPLKFTKNPWKMKSYFLSGGTEGTGGLAGNCGPNPASNGKSGLRGASGQFTINKNSIVSHDNNIIIRN